jgi:hypothetical protein
MLRSSLEEKEEALCEICGENIALPRKPGIARVA